MDEKPVETLPAPIPRVSLDPPVLSKLAREIAYNMRDLDVILKDYNITLEQFKVHIDPNEMFKRFLEASLIEWNSVGSTHERLRLEAAITLEDTMKYVAARMVKEDEDLGKVVEAGKMFANIAGIGKDKVDVAAGEKFSIVINLGADQIKFEKDITPGSQPALLPDPKGAGAAPAPQQITLKAGEATTISNVPEGTSNAV